MTCDPESLKIIQEMLGEVLVVVLVVVFVWRITK